MIRLVFRPGFLVDFSSQCSCERGSPRNLSQQSRRGCCRQEWRRWSAPAADQALCKPDTANIVLCWWFWLLFTCCRVMMSDWRPAKCLTSLKILSTLMILTRRIILPVLPITSKSSRPSVKYYLITILYLRVQTKKNWDEEWNNCKKIHNVHSLFQELQFSTKMFLGFFKSELWI